MADNSSNEYLRTALEHVRASAQTGTSDAGVVISFAAFQAVREALETATPVATCDTPDFCRNIRGSCKEVPPQVETPCEHPLGLLMYHGFVSGQVGDYRCDRCSTVIYLPNLDSREWAAARAALKASSTQKTNGEPVECEHLRSDLLAAKRKHGEPLFEMRKCLDCHKTFRVRKNGAPLHLDAADCRTLGIDPAKAGEYHKTSAPPDTSRTCESASSADSSGGADPFSDLPVEQQS